VSVKTNRQRKKFKRAKRALLRIRGKRVVVMLQTNPRARRYIVKVNPSTGEVSVVAPDSRSLDLALAFARKERAWIAHRLAHIPRRVPLKFGKHLMYRGRRHEVRYGGRNRKAVWTEGKRKRWFICVSQRGPKGEAALRGWLKREARKQIKKRVAIYAEMLHVRPKRITIRDTTSRWGSCSSTRCLSFSWRLILAPPRVFSYVVAHEVAHLRALSHSKRFWAIVEELVGNSANSQAWLADNGAALHRYAPRGFN
jgi:predicted metal-dependent hydrolase